MEPVTADHAGGNVLPRVLSQKASDETKEILRQVVLKGTGKEHVQSELYSTAKKTASPSVPNLRKGGPFLNSKKANLAGFIGFAPIFRRIVDEVLKHMGVPSDKTDL